MLIHVPFASPAQPPRIMEDLIILCQTLDLEDNIMPYSFRAGNPLQNKQNIHALSFSHWKGILVGLLPIYLQFPDLHFNTHVSLLTLVVLQSNSLVYCRSESSSLDRLSHDYSVDSGHWLHLSSIVVVAQGNKIYYSCCLFECLCFPFLERVVLLSLYYLYLNTCSSTMRYSICWSD